MYSDRNLSYLRLFTQIPAKAGLTDELTASIHYGEVSHMITKFAKEHTYKLLEALAENLCQMLLSELPLIKKDHSPHRETMGSCRASAGYSCR